jgi:hypothetical protein
MTSTVRWRELMAHPVEASHMVQVYQDEEFLGEAAGYFICNGLRQGDGVLVIATAEHQHAFRNCAGKEGLDLRAAERVGQLAFLDADSTLSSFMKGGMPDRARFFDTIGDAAGRLQSRYPKMRAYGEMVDLLWQREQRAAAARLEEFWELLRERRPFALLCGYCLDYLDPDQYRGALQTVCCAHTHLIADRDDEFQSEVDAAAQKVLGPSLACAAQALAAKNPSATSMSSGQSILFYLAENMPLTAQKILMLTRAGRRYGADD